MEKTFRDYHLFQILNSLDFGSVPLDVHLGIYFRTHKAIGSKDRKFIAEKIYTLIRWLGLIDYFCEGSHNWSDRYEALKKIDLQKETSDSQIPAHVRCSFPKYFFNLLTSCYGEEKAMEICLASNTVAPTTVRVNLLKITRDELFSKLENHFSISKTKTSSSGIIFENKINFNELPEFKDGLFEVQDEASQLVANLVNAKPGDRVLDYCAGAGGKTLGFAPKLEGGGQIYLHDIRERSLIEAKKRLKRAGIGNGQILPFNSPNKNELKGKMDWVLVDVPCSGSGTLRRNPDIKWKFSQGTLDQLVQEQRSIFHEALSYLTTNGKMIYSTCSILPQENENQIHYFKEKYGLHVLELPFSSLPTIGGMDGFFAATLVK